MDFLYLLPLLFSVIAVGSYGFYKHAARHTDGTDDIRNATNAQKGLMTAAQAEEVDSILAYKARAYHGGTPQVVANETLTIIELNTESYDPGNAFDVTNYYYVVQKAGYYLIDAALEFNVGVIDQKLVNIHIRIGASSIIDNVFNSSGTAEITALASGIHYFALNDQIAMGVWHNFGGNATLKNIAGRTYMCIHFISE